VLARRSIIVAVAVAAVVLAGRVAGDTRPAAAAEPVTLRIVFPEGFSVRQMVDRVAEVRQIAIRRRHVTPRLTGASYAAAAARARPSPPFRRSL
jgi:hypothetical protein